MGHTATDSDVIAGTTSSVPGKTIPLTLSPLASSHGLRALYRGPELSYEDAALHTYLKNTVYEGNGLFDIYRAPLLMGLVSFGLMLPFSIRRDIVRRKQLKYGRRLKGPVLMTPKEFNKAVAGDGIDLQKTPVEQTANQQTQAKESPMTNSREHPQDDLRRQPPAETMASIPEIVRTEPSPQPQPPSAPFSRTSNSSSHRSRKPQKRPSQPMSKRLSSSWKRDTAKV